MQVYDSYMGILRISPEPIDGNENSTVDDVSQKLSQLKDASGEDRRLELSDSDGNMFKIYFVPKAFMQKTYKSNGLEAVIHIQTALEKPIYSSNELNVRSTLELDKIGPSQAEGQPGTERLSRLVVRATGQTSLDGSKWVLYPTESPNDSNYFNEKNKLELFDPEGEENHYYEVQDALLQKPLSWYNQSDIKASEIVRKEDGVTPLRTMNVFEEGVPILHTRDYVLGIYDCHNVKTQESAAETEGWSIQDLASRGWIDTSQFHSDNMPQNGDYFTKLSWIRIDNLVWDMLREILNGNVRHYKGRYRELGYDVVENGDGKGFQPTGNVNFDNTNFFRFENGHGQGYLSLSQAAASTPFGFLEENGELLGQDVAPGVIMYNAMPLHRYMFHVMRQRAYNYTKEEHASVPTSGDWRQEVGQLKENEIITEYAMFNPSFTNNLSKNFLLCDGREISSEHKVSVYENYPSINTNNFKLFVPDDQKMGCARDANGIPLQQQLSDDTIYYSLTKTPSLLSPHEAAPRLIRGASYYIDNYKNSASDPNRDMEGDSVKENIDVYTFNRDKNLGHKIKYPTNEANAIYSYNFNAFRKDKHDHHIFSAPNAVPTSKRVIRECMTLSQQGKITVTSNNDDGSVPNHSIPLPDEDFNSSRPWRIENGFYSSGWLNGSRPIPTGMLWYECDGDKSAYGNPNFSDKAVYLYNGNGENRQPQTLAGNNLKWWCARASEQEGMNPIAVCGGWNYVWRNYWWRKCARYRIMGKCTGHYENHVKVPVQGAGSYYVATYVDDTDVIMNMGITSIPYENVHFLGGVNEGSLDKRLWYEKNDTLEINNDGNNISLTHPWDHNRNKPSVKYGTGNQFLINDYIPQTPSMSLLPLIRI